MIFPGCDRLKLITRDELKNMMDAKVPFTLIDARTHGGYEKEHLPGAIRIPADHLGEHLVNDHKKTETFVTYCTDLKCESSTIAAKKLEKFGFIKVFDFKGGIEDWKKAGYPTEK
jgi:rhodanese-related sulfurtransferase